MHDGPVGRRRLRGLLGFVLLSLAATEAKYEVDGSEGQDELFVSVTRSWRVDGSEQRTLGESITRLRKDLQIAEANLALVSEAIQSTAARLPESGVVEKLARIEATVSEVGERIAARWQREHAARQREQEQREREAAERARGVR